MKQKTINFKAIFFILFIQFFSLYIKCEEHDCSSCTLTENICTNCNINCKSKLFDSIGCKYCNFNGEDFYKIEGDNCNPKSQCEDGEKIVFKSNECVSGCSNFFEMGDYCYYSAPTNSQCDDSNKRCHCLYKYYITTTIDSKKEYHCLSQTDDCPNNYDYYMFPNKECLKESDLPGICTYKKIEFRGETSIITRCSAGCASNENEVSGNYCVDNCNNLGKKFYYPFEEKPFIVQCLDNCSSKNLKELNGKCVISCQAPNLYLNENNECSQNWVVDFIILMMKINVLVNLHLQIVIMQKMKYLFQKNVILLVLLFHLNISMKKMEKFVQKKNVIIILIMVLLKNVMIL